MRLKDGRVGQANFRWCMGAGPQGQGAPCCGGVDRLRKRLEQSHTWGATMGLRTKITDGIKNAMREKDTVRLSTLRLINAAVKDQDIAVRVKGNADGVPDADVLSIMAKMVKQRQESARVYEEGGRLELAEQEQAEIAVIEEYLPRQLSSEEVASAVDAAIADAGADSIRDMGRVMGTLKGKYAGRMDFGKVGPLVKERLG